MARLSSISFLLVTLLVAASVLPPAGQAGDEDAKKEKVAAPPVEPEPSELPTAPDAPDLSVGEEPTPAFRDTTDASLTPPAAARPTRKPWDPDANVDYTDLLSRVLPLEADRGVLPPSLGFRGYLPNMVAASIGDRTPGYGAIIEYNRNRIGFGAFYSYRDLRDDDQQSYSQSYAGIYGLYRWLPFSISPLFLIGLETSSRNRTPFGGLAGLGMDVRIYSGWTALLGYTYHSTARRGFLGGGMGWSF